MILDLRLVILDLREVIENNWAVSAKFARAAVLDQRKQPWGRNHMRFAEFFKKATGLEQGPYPFQRAFAEAEADRLPQQPKVNVTFTLIGFLALVDLDG